MKAKSEIDSLSSSDKRMPSRSLIGYSALALCLPALWAPPASLADTCISQGADGAQGKAGQDGAPLSGFCLDASTGELSVISIGGQGGQGEKNSTGGHGGAGGAITATLSGTITAGATDAVYAASIGGGGGNGGDDSGGYAGAGGAGGYASDVRIISSGTTINANNGIGVYLLSQGGAGHQGQYGSTRGGDGGAGGAAGSIFVDDPADFAAAQRQAGSWNITTSGSSAPAFLVQSIGGNGGGGEKKVSGGNGGNGGNITIFDSGQTRTLTTSGAQSPGLYALSLAGAGGDGDQAQNSGGGNGGIGGTVSIAGEWKITTTSDESPGLVASSQGGAGGEGSKKDPGGSAGNGGEVDINLGEGSVIQTQAQDSTGILGQSIGGRAGSATGGSGFLHLVNFGADAGSAGDGAGVNITNSGQITTQGDGSNGIVAQSIGGGGGSGGAGFGLFFSKGGQSTPGGHGGNVEVINNTGATLTLAGSDAIGILAQSIGGTGGNGSSSTGLLALGGNAGGGGNGGTVNVQSSANISTAQTAQTASGGSLGILAQSIGGGGGHGGSSGGWFSLGGTGGDGGTGGQAVVNHASGTIGTSLDNSTAILAQSIGGGGGNGGGAVTAGVVVSIAVGGQDGSGGASGEATAYARDGMSLQTGGRNSHGLVAQSIGGGGGNGGFAGALAVSGSEAPSLAIAIGGKGGSGGSAGAATASTYDSAYTGTKRNSILTTGSNSFGVFAQSVGGGGGSGGFATSTSVGMSAAFALAIGGNGGKGGDGNTAEIGNDADITTHGDGSTALFAQSVGGGGGQGALGASGGLGLFGGGIDLGFGGRGKTAGNGNNANVVNQGGSSIVTYGKGADGILAQSVGGGGGAGGMSVAEQVSVGAATGNFSLSFGGSAGAGGSAGEAQVTNDGQITLNGGGSSAIFAQSVGGGGGKGGSSIAGSIGLTNGWEGALSLGGHGGSGGVGGVVSVNNSGALQANGALGGTPDLTPGYGIFAQSVGGGGGQGGYAGAWTFQAISAGSNQPPTVSIPIALGGDGGSGNKGSSVGVTNTGAITTTANLSPAILAQSIGGGGGVGGNSAAGSHHLPGIGSPTLELSVALGGSGGGGATGGDVTVGNAAALSTLGNGSHGIFAQSVGGGGGLGGHAKAENQHGVLDDDGFKLGTAAAQGEGDSINPTIALTLGGNAGAGSNGGNVSVTNSASITTQGTGAAAILAQSVGGGGGAGSDQGNEEGVDPQGWLAEAFDNGYQNLQITLGGNGGGASSGGKVSVTHSGGKLLTNYDGSAGIFAQSVGGGGGLAGAASTGAQGSIALGGTGAAGGNGGEVDVTFTNGSIETHGAGITPSFGIFAQSVGGGGGTGGMGQLTNWLDFGTKLALSGKPGSGGNGGAVNVQFTGGSIQTSADGAVGIFAQSVGGGGGLQGGVMLPAAGNPVTLKTGTSGAAGSGGAVTVAVGGDIHTTGDAAHGVFAQSLGTDGSELVSVNVSGSIHADGQASHGIYAQSYGKGEGAVGITIQKGATVSGGGVSPDSTVANDGAGIVIKDSGDNASAITNAGTITSASGNAIVFVDSGDVGVQNSGTITGNVCNASTSSGTNTCAPATPAAQARAMSATGGVSSATPSSGGSITLHNQPGGLINAGAIMDVALLDNQGTLTVAGVGVGATGATRVSGDLVQGQGGVLVVDLVPGKTDADVQADRLEVGGHAELAGKLAVQLADDWKPVLGVQSVELVHANGGLSVEPGALSVTPSAVARYHLAQPNAGSLNLGYDIHFANSAILAHVNDNQDALARNIHALYSAGELSSKFANALIAIADAHAYAGAMNSLSPEVAVDNQIGSLFSSMRFSDQLFNCSAHSGGGRFMQQGQCGWMQVQAQNFNQGSTDDNLGFNERSWQLAGGGQVDLDADWRLGGALSYENRRLDVNDAQANSDGYQAQGGLYLTRRLGAAELSGSLSLGSGDFDLDRTLWTGAQTTASQRMWLASTQLRAAYLIEQDNWYIKPRIDLGVDYLSVDGFNESGSSVQRLDVAGSDNAYVNIQPAVEFGSEIKADGGTLIRPRLTLGVTQFIGDATPSSEARFATSGAGVPSFTASTELDRTRLNLSAGVDVLTRNNITTRIEVFGSVSENTETYGGELKFSVPF